MLVDKMKCTLLIAAIVAIIDIAAGACSSGTRYANAYSQSESIVPSFTEHCTLYISPALLYRLNSYFLEITWDQSRFDVKGNMPLCREEYVEVFLTGSYLSIGRFCSRNAGPPFTMYSKDGYAKIVYHTNGYNYGTGFRFSYRLRSTKASALGGSPNMGNCHNTYNYADSGTIYSTGWPSGYSSSFTACDYQISKRAKYSRVYIAFMDVSMYPYGYPRDCVKMSGYNFSTYSQYRGSEDLCKENYIATYVAYTDVIKIKFNRGNGQGYNSKYSGFVAGYVMYGNAAHSQRKTTYIPTHPPVVERVITSKSSEASTDGSMTTISIVIGIAALVIMILVIIIGIAIGLKPRRRPIGSNALIENEDVTNEAMPEQSRAPQTTRISSSLNNTGYVLLPSQQYPHQTAEIDTRCYPSGSFITSHNPVTNSSSFGQSTTAPSAPSQSEFMATLSNNSIPAGARQPPSMAVHHPSTASSNSEGNPSVMMERPSASPNIPPPAYY